VFILLLSKDSRTQLSTDLLLLFFRLYLLLVVGTVVPTVALLVLVVLVDLLACILPKAVESLSDIFLACLPRDFV